jgi:hypothetical protein
MIRRNLRTAAFASFLAALGCGGQEWHDREEHPCLNAGRPPPCNGTSVATGRPPRCSACVRGCPRQGVHSVLDGRGCGDQEGLACSSERSLGYQTHRCVCGADERWSCTVEHALDPTALYIDRRRYAPPDPQHGAAWPAELEGVEVDWATEVAAVWGSGPPWESRAVGRHDPDVQVSSGVFHVVDLDCPDEGGLVLRFRKDQTVPSEVRVECRASPPPPPP